MKKRFISSLVKKLLFFSPGADSNEYVVEDPRSFVIAS